MQTSSPTTSTCGSRPELFGTCGKPAPAPLSYPAPAPPSVPTPVPGNQPPVAAFTSSRLSGPGNQVRLDASGSSDPDGSIAAYEWSSGGKILGTGENLVASLGANASVPVTLQVTDNRGATATATQTLSLPDRPPAVVDVTPAPDRSIPTSSPCCRQRPGTTTTTRCSTATS